MYLVSQKAVYVWYAWSRLSTNAVSPNVWCVSNMYRTWVWTNCAYSCRAHPLTLLLRTSHIWTWLLMKRYDYTLQLQGTQNHVLFNEVVLCIADGAMVSMEHSHPDLVSCRALLCVSVMDCLILLLTGCLEYASRPQRCAEWRYLKGWIFWYQYTTYTLWRGCGVTQRFFAPKGDIIYLLACAMNHIHIVMALILTCGSKSQQDVLNIYP